MSAEDFHRLNQEVAKERELRWQKEQERDRLRQALFNLFHEARPFTQYSKDLKLECENAEAIMQELEEI
jgi:uncharacterized membrane protein YgaE (UPF0421/DUF939 family)